MLYISYTFYVLSSSKHAGDSGQSFMSMQFDCSVNGDVRLWDIRARESFKVINASVGLTALDAHQHAEVIAW